MLAELAQAVFAIVTGISLIRDTMFLTQLHTGVNLAPSTELGAHYGVGVLVIAVLIIGLISIVAVPAQWARALLVVLEVFGLGVTLAAHFGGGSCWVSSRSSRWARRAAASFPSER